MRKLFLFVAGIVWLCFAPLLIAQDTGAVPGRIAYIGEDYNVYTVSPQGDSAPLTNDASVTETAIRIYEMPTWSPDDRLAYFATTADTAGRVQVETFISPDGTTPGVSAHPPTDETFTYASWSPQSCGDDCRDLAVLLGGASGFSVELLRARPDEVESTITGMGSPFYFSWSPDGTWMLWQRNNQQFDIYDTTQAEIVEQLDHVPGMMFAPSWSPVDDRLLFAVQNGDTTDLVIAANGDLQTLLAGQGDPLWFAWSPDGNYVAYLDRQGPLIILDAVSGEVVARSPVNGVLASFWSPDSERIAYVTPAASAPGSFNASAPNGVKLAAFAQQDGATLAWSVLEIADGANRRYGAFLPTPEELYILTFFDQFGQSHRVWSPDSTHLVYSEITPGQRPVISLLDVTQTVAVPLVLADGVIGIWSFN